MDAELVAAIRSGNRERARHLLSAGANRGFKGVGRDVLPARSAPIPPTNVRALWAAMHKSNRVLARRASSLPAKGQGSGWRGGQRLAVGRTKLRTLNSYEFGQFVDRVLFAKPRLATRFFQLLDGDGDAELSAVEWQGMIQLLCHPTRRADRVSFLFDLMDPSGSGGRAGPCQSQVTGRDASEGRQIDEAAVEYFFRKYLVPADDTVDIVLESVERYFGLAPSNSEKRGDGRKVPAAHHGMLGTNRPTARKAHKQLTRNGRPFP